MLTRSPEANVLGLVKSGGFTPRSERSIGVIMLESHGAG
jgi:hypothetical protein